MEVGRGSPPVGSNIRGAADRARSSVGFEGGVQSRDQRVGGVYARPYDLARRHERPSNPQVSLNSVVASRIAAAEQHQRSAGHVVADAGQVPGRGARRDDRPPAGEHAPRASIPGPGVSQIADVRLEPAEHDDALADGIVIPGVAVGQAGVEAAAVEHHPFSAMGALGMTADRTIVPPFAAGARPWVFMEWSRRSWCSVPGKSESGLR